jgi:outer membrane protein assembly factor BamB
VAGGGDIWWGKNEAWMKCIDATGNGDITHSGLIWSYPLEKHVLATPSIADGLAFVGDVGRTFHCVDVKTGKACWTHEVKGEIWASALVADGKVYIGTRGGSFYIFAAAREKKLLCELELGQPVSGTVSAANGVLYITTMTSLYAVAQPKQL